MLQLQPLLALSVLVINEVLYDPVGADTGREYVEILNVSGEWQSLEDVELQVGDGASGSWRAAWRGAGEQIAPGALFVVGGDSLQRRDARLMLSLQNGPDAVRLLQAAQRLDLVGYGDLDSPDLFEGAPAPDVSGVGLSRIPDGSDTDRNSIDFRPAPASPGRLNAPPRAFRLELEEPDPTRLWPWRSLAFHLQVHNVGWEALEPGAYGITAGLRVVSGEPAIDSWTLGPEVALDVEGAATALAPGDSAVHRARWNGELGLFQLRASLQGSDADSTDNEDSLFVRIGAGPILVNEIFFAPEPGDAEWIELFNRDTRPHDLNGWTLADATGRETVLRAMGPLAPGGFALVEADTTQPHLFPTTEVLRVQASPWPSLNNSDADDGFADAVLLRDAAGLVDDALRYSAAWGAGRGRSIERLTADPDARGLLWAACKDPQGSTAGRVNSATAPPGWSTQLSLQPNPFSPDGDGHEDLLAIAFEIPQGHAGFQVHLYDSSGRRRRHLAGDRLGPGPRRLAWDGTDDAGVPLATGVYVLHLELLGGTDGETQLRSVGLVRP